VIGVIVLSGVVFVIFFGVQTVAVVFLKKQAVTMPEMSLVPAQLNVVSPTGMPGRRFSYFGYEFELPWLEVEEEVSESSVRILSASGKFVLFYDPTQQFDLLEETVMPNPGARDEFVAQFGSMGYEFYKRVFNATPDQLSIFMSRRECVEVTMRLAMKSMVILTSDSGSGLYAFEHGELRGFQLGDPAAGGMVIVHIFDASDQHLEFSFAASQDDINRLIDTLKPAERSYELQVSPEVPVSSDVK